MAKNMEELNNVKPNDEVLKEVELSEDDLEQVSGGRNKKQLWGDVCYICSREETRGKCGYFVLKSTGFGFNCCYKCFKENGFKSSDFIN